MRSMIVIQSVGTTESHSGKYLADVLSWINVLYLNKGRNDYTNHFGSDGESILKKVCAKVVEKFHKILYYSTILKNENVVRGNFAAIHMG